MSTMSLARSASSSSRSDSGPVFHSQKVERGMPRRAQSLVTGVAVGVVGDEPSRDQVTGSGVSQPGQLQGLGPTSDDLVVRELRLS